MTLRPRLTLWYTLLLAVTAFTVAHSITLVASQTDTSVSADQLRSDLLEQLPGATAKQGALDLSPILASAATRNDETPWCSAERNPPYDPGRLNHAIVDACADALNAGDSWSGHFGIRNNDRSVGAMLAGEVALNEQDYRTAAAEFRKAAELSDDVPRRRRELLERHAFTAVAAALVVAFLAVSFFLLQSRHEAARADSSTLIREQNDRRQNERRLTELRERRAALAVEVDELEKRRAAGESLVHTLALLGRHLPEDLWIREVELDFEEAVGRVQERRARIPLVRVEGAGKSRGA